MRSHSTASLGASCLNAKCLLLTALTLAGAGCVGVTADQEASQPQEIIGGKPVTWETPVRRLDDGCSAVKIGPHALLTAGHCVLADPRNIDAGLKENSPVWGYKPGLEIMLNPYSNDSGNNEYLTVVDTSVLRPYAAGGQWDLAIIRTVEEIHGLTATIGGAPANEQQITLMGFGCTTHVQ
jgi:hypothetical protein